MTTKQIVVVVNICLGLAKIERKRNEIDDRLPVGGHACDSLNVAGCGQQAPGTA